MYVRLKLKLIKCQKSFGINRKRFRYAIGLSDRYGIVIFMATLHYNY